MLVGVGQIAKFAQWHKATLDIFNARFYDSLFLRVSGRTGIDSKTIAFGTLAVGALDFRLVIARFGDGALGVVDNNARR